MSGEMTAKGEAKRIYEKFYKVIYEYRGVSLEDDTLVKVCISVVEEIQEFSDLDDIEFWKEVKEMIPVYELLSDEKRKEWT